MIHIETEQYLVDSTNLKVSSPTGDYEDQDLIECVDRENSVTSVIAYQAQYVKYGGMVYSFGSSKELGVEILKVDPQSTHAAASYVRMIEELDTQMNQGELEPSSLKNVLSDEQEVMEEKRAEPEIQETPQIKEEVLEDTPVEEVVVPEIIPSDTLLENPEPVLTTEETLSVVTNKKRRPRRLG